MPCLTKNVIRFLKQYFNDSQFCTHDCHSKIFHYTEGTKSSAKERSNKVEDSLL